MERDCDELELELELSLGGSFRRKETTNVKEISHVEDKNMQELRKREMHALRRQEAKKKRDEKQQRKGKGKKNERVRVRERESRKKHEEEDEEERGCKREKVQKILHVSKNNKDLNVNLSNENPSSAFQPFPHPQYSYPQMQYVPVSNGYAFGHYVMPFSTPEATSSENKAVALVRPLASRSFVPYRAPGGCALWQNSNARKENDESSGSPKGSSSVISDYQSSSYQGGSSTASGSHSSHLKSDYELNGLTVNHEHANNSNQNSHAQMISNATFSEKMSATSVSESSSIKNDEVRKTVDTSKRTVFNIENPTKEAEVNKMSNQSTPILPQMPFVSTTGNGLNGKKITGFLYKYSTTEVNIVCVCHGTSFSPSEFILHAGGTDITNPLKHITVIPFPF